MTTIIKDNEMLYRYKLPMWIQTERNKRKRIQEEFMSIPKNYQIPVKSTEQVFTLNTGTPINSIQYGSFRILKRRRRIRTQVPNSVVKLRGLIPPGKTGDQALPMLLVNWSAEFVISTTDPFGKAMVCTGRKN
jgi:hypothetical protein